jgi:hypothetical protein
MVDDNRFSGLGDQLEDGSAEDTTDDEDEEPDEAGGSATDTGTTDKETTSEQSGGSIESDSRRAETDQVKEKPAFEFSATKQDPLYPIEETWQEYADVLDFEVRRVLREDGYKNIEKRELHEATLRVVIENPELVTQKFRDLRQQ